MFCGQLATGSLLGTWRAATSRESGASTDGWGSVGAIGSRVWEKLGLKAAREGQRPDQSRGQERQAKFEPIA